MTSQGQVLPLKTETAAYQGNSNIKVWVSFDPSSLRLDRNGNVIAGSDGLIEGDDPLDINNTLEKFDYSFGTGGVVGFKLKLINPSTRLEVELTKIYKNLYEKGDPAREYSNTDETTTPPFPTFYIRWGYGTSLEEGISSIHAAKLVDIKYRLNAKRERITELTLMDPFSFAGESTLNPIAQEGLSAEALLYDGDKLKLPSRLIGELFSDFGKSFPEISFYTDLDGGDVGKGLDASLYEILASISEGYSGDVLVKLQRGESLEDPIVTEAFSEREQAAIENAINTQQDPRQFLASLPYAHRANNIGVVVLAYKLLFTRLGFNFLYYRTVEESRFPGVPAVIQYAHTSAKRNSLKEDENQTIMRDAEILLDTEAFISINDGGPFRPATPEEILEIKSQLGITYDSLPATITIPQTVNPDDMIRQPSIWVAYKNYYANPGIFEKDGDKYYPFYYGLGPSNNVGRAQLTVSGLSMVRSQLSIDRERYFPEETQEQSLEATVPLPKDSKILKQDREIYRITYDSDQNDSDQNETVLQGLQKVLTNINTLLVDRINRVWYSFVDFNSLNENERNALIEGDAKAAYKSKVATFFNKLGIPKEEFKNSIGMVLITDEATLKKQGLSGSLKRIFSFPEITTTASFTDGDSDSIPGDNFIFLDVAAKDSIVVDVNFTGDQRVLASLAQIPQITRQTKQFQDLFKSPEESYDVLAILVSEAISERGGIPDKVRRKTAREQGIINSTEFIYDKKIQNLVIPYLNILVQDGNKLKAFQDYFSLRQQGARTPRKTNVDKDFILNLLSILQSDRLLDKLFPLNKKSISSYYKLDGTTIARETEPLKLTRDIKIFEGLSKNGNFLDSYIKDTVMAAQNLSNEAWKVEVVTLGVPELDIPPQELSSRVVVLNVWDERTQSLHWLSGTYQILGLAHAIDPSKGYLTKLKLFKGVL